ncbi:MAG TPA: insulinase family protein [Drouetiella sp.]
MARKSRKNIALSLLLSLLVGLGQPSQAQSPAKVQQLILPNGLKVLLLEDHSLPVVSCFMWYRVGSRNEAPGLTGLCHLVEHMLFHRVGAFKKGELGATIVRNGGQFNGFTSDDFTAFFETVHPSKLDLMLRIESDRMRKTNFTSQDLKEELARINQDIDEQSKDQQIALDHEVRAAAYSRHPYRHPTIGSKDDIGNITLQDVKTFYDRFYYPDNATLVVVGDMSAQPVASVITRYFGSLPKSPNPVPATGTTEPTQDAERRIVIQQPGKRDLVELAYHAPAFADADAPAVMVLEKILNANFSGRLRKLVESKSAFAAKSSYELKRDPGLFTINFNIAPNTMPKLLEAWDATITSIKAQPVADAELRRGRNIADLSYASENDGPHGDAFNIGFCETLHSWKLADEWADRLKGVTAADVQRVAKKYFANENRVVGLLSATGNPVKPNSVKPVATKISPTADADLDEHSPIQSSEETVQKNSRLFNKVGLLGFKRSDAAVPDFMLAQKLLMPTGTLPEPEPRSVKEQINSSEKQLVAQDQPKPKTPSSESSNATHATSVSTGSAHSTGAAASSNSGHSTGAAASSNSSHPTGAAVSSNATHSTGGATPLTSTHPTGTTSSAATHSGSGSASTSGHSGTASGTTGAARSTGSVGSTSAGHAPGTTTPSTSQLPPKVVVKPLVLEATPPKVKEKILKNGLTVLVLENPLCPIMQITGVVRAGTAFEPPNKHGISDLMTACMNNGSTKMSRQQLQLAQEDLGLTPNAMLQFEPGLQTINFKIRCMSRDLSSAFNYIGTCLREPLVHGNDLEKAKRDVLNQFRLVDDSSTIKTERALLRSLISPMSAYYPDDLNNKATAISAFKSNELDDFHGQNVLPEATTIVIVGDVNADLAFRLAEQTFGSWEQNTSEAKSYPPMQANPRRVVKTSIPIKDRTKAFVSIGRLVDAPGDTPNYAYLMLADCMLTNHPIFSRLAQRVGADPSLSDNLSPDAIDSRFVPLGGTIAWALNIPVEPNIVPTVASLIQGELKKFASNSMSAAEFAEMKRFLVNAVPVRQFSTDTDAAKTILECYVQSSKAEGFNEEVANLKSAKLENLTKFVRTVLKPDQSSLVIAATTSTLHQVHGGRSGAGVDAQNAQPVKENGTSGSAESSAQN